MEEDMYLDAAESGYPNHKDIVIKRINGIRIENFRSFKGKRIDLGNIITVVSGKNGTMKSTLLGLIAHPFSSPNDARDSFGNELKTSISDVFYLSPEKDIEPYLYYLRITTTDDIIFEEPIRVYRRMNPNGTYRHRLTVGTDNKKGSGNFSLNTSYVNLKRLIPIVDTNAQIVNKDIEKSLKRFVSEGYMKILQKEAFSEPVQVSDKSTKQTFGPGIQADYDYKSISSGEDNIGNILNKMHSFLQYKSSNSEALQGIFCIDEFEASLHPVAQKNLFNYIYNWAKNNNIQVVINTHSLYLIQYVIDLQGKLKHSDDVVLNMISTAFVSDNNFNIIKNPNYNEAYKELTLSDNTDIKDVYKVLIICEDDVAEHYLKRIISKRTIIDRLSFVHSLNEGKEGNGCQGLKSLIKNGRKLLESSLVIFDPEVDVSDLSNYKGSFLVLPSIYSMPIEKEIAKYIYDLPGDDDFFVSFNEEKASFINSFTNCGILDLSDVEKTKNDNIKKYKSWADKDINKFKRIITYYSKHNKNNRFFLDELIALLNARFVQKGLPIISID